MNIWIRICYFPGSGKVNEPEFRDGWNRATLMADPDANYLFEAWSILKDRTEPEFIVDPNIEGLWEEMDTGRTSGLFEGP